LLSTTKPKENGGGNKNLKAQKNLVWGEAQVCEKGSYKQRKNTKVCDKKKEKCSKVPDNTYLSNYIR
jgi:hypothetical protein